MLLLRLIRLVRKLRRRKLIGLLTVLGLVAVCVLGNAVCFFVFDGVNGDGQPLSFGDALWYSVVSITTVGYGDYAARSFCARIGTVFFIMVLGLATFSIFLGMIIEWITDAISKGKRGMSTVMAADHVLIVNFPSEHRVGMMIEELRRDPRYRDTEIVLVNDTLDHLPFDSENVFFVKGSVLSEETYLRAAVLQARMGIILASSYDDPNSDALVASAVAVIESLNPKIYTVAESMDPRHRVLFRSVHCNAVVPSLHISGNLLVQEAADPGIAQMVEALTSRAEGASFFSTEVAETPPAMTYSDLARALLGREISLMAVNRGKESVTTFFRMKPQVGDRLIYAAPRRYTWPELVRP